MYKIWCFAKYIYITSVLVQPNVLVGENGTAVLADFGIAKAFTTGFKSSTRNNGGTFEYM